MTVVSRPCLVRMPLFFDHESGYRQHFWLAEDLAQSDLRMSSNGLVNTAEQLCDATLASAQEEIFERLWRGRRAHGHSG